MRHSILKSVAYAVLLAAIMFGTIAVYLLPSACPRAADIAVLVITVLLEIASMGYFIVQDIIGNKTVISKYGSLNLFETVDCEGVSKAVFRSLTENPSAHVIYINCRGLNVNSIENVKQKLYEDLTACKNSLKKFHIKRRLNVRSVYVPAALDIESLYESVFYSTNRFASGINVYIYDMNTANEFFVDRIATRLENQINAAQSKSGKTAAAKTVRRTYIVYLTNNHKNTAIGTGLHGQELREMVRAKIGCDYDFEDKFAIDIKNVLVINDILENEFHRDFVLAYPPNLLVIYYLKTGEYEKALDILVGFADCNSWYCVYLLADTLHLLNMYHAAYTLCSTLLGSKIASPFENEVIILQAHILKHMGLFDSSFSDADWHETNSTELLKKVRGSGSAQHDAVSVEIKLLVNEYFDGLLKQLERRFDCYDKHDAARMEETRTRLLAILKNVSDPDQKLYAAAFGVWDNPSISLKLIDDIIEYYERTENRRRFNAYYVKAEILRIMHKYGCAYEFYVKSSGMLDGHRDVNLLDQNYFSLKALETLGLATGIASLHVREYKKKYYTEYGARTDEKEIVEITRKVLAHLNCDEDTRHFLRFNTALLNYIDSDQIDKKALLELLMRNVFIIL